MQTNRPLTATTIGHSWPIADGLLWGVWAAKADVNQRHDTAFHGLFRVTERWTREQVAGTKRLQTKPSATHLASRSCGPLKGKASRRVRSATRAPSWFD